MALAGEYFISFKDNNGEEIALKCRPIKKANGRLILVKDRLGTDVSVLVDSMKFEDDYGIIGVDRNNVQVGLTFVRPTFIGICWIDEADPNYTDNRDHYLAHLDDFKRITNRIQKWTAGCQVPGHPPEDVIYGTDYPINYGVPITIETIGRPPTSSELISRFNILLQSFQSLEPTTVLYPDYLILTIDSSGSMGIDTIQPAYDQFKSYISSHYPLIIIVERIFSNENWLSIWSDQISNIV